MEGLNIKKRKSVTEPIEDAIFVDASLQEELPVEGLVTELVEETSEQSSTKEANEPKIAEQDSEKVLTVDERKLELSLILDGLKLRKEKIITESEKAVKKIQKDMEDALSRIDLLAKQYTSEYNELVKRSDI